MILVLPHPSHPPARASMATFTFGKRRPVLYYANRDDGGVDVAEMWGSLSLPSNRSEPLDRPVAPLDSVFGDPDVAAELDAAMVAMVDHRILGVWRAW
jgi:hypothetical protein